MYNGQLDIIVGVPLTQAYLQVLPWSGLDQYLNTTKTVWRITPSDVEAAGYARTVGDFVQVGKRFLNWAANNELSLVFLSRMPPEGHFRVTSYCLYTVVFRVSSPVCTLHIRITRSQLLYWTCGDSYAVRVHMTLCCSNAVAT